MRETITIGILEDHPAIADGYKTKIELESDMRVDWIANFYQDVALYLNEFPTDAIILDIQVYNSPGDVNLYPVLHAIPNLLENYPQTKILVISMINRPAVIKAVYKAGANGYILKNDGPSYENLGKILKDMVINNQGYFSPEAAQFLISKNTQPILTPRQSEILSLMASNPAVSYQEMAETLFISVNTVRNHVAEICRKLDVNNRTSAVLKAKQIGLIPDDPL
ncbi:response regulator transcription factor [bacterium]|nr:response regulator transcription factor [bacterium]MCB2178982.1 response regulator transcription factor [bacterium]